MSTVSTMMNEFRGDRVLILTGDDILQQLAISASSLRNEDRRWWMVLYLLGWAVFFDSLITRPGGIIRLLDSSFFKEIFVTNYSTNRDENTKRLFSARGTTYEMVDMALWLVLRRGRR
jgi:hypothetical protein